MASHTVRHLFPPTMPIPRSFSLRYSIASQTQSPNLQRFQQNHAHNRTFSTSPLLLKQRKQRRDSNRSRGVSALRATGTRHTLSVSKYPLPKPVLDPKLRDQIKGDENHGLWGFFNKGKTRFGSPEADVAFGRAWSVAELRTKSWEDLHSLWWVCALERNRIATAQAERKRLKAHFGEGEALYRDETVQETQKAIRKVLTERWVAWEAARKRALTDETVDLSGEGPAFQPFMQAVDREDGRRDPNAPVEI